MNKEAQWEIKSTFNLIKEHHPMLLDLDEEVLSKMERESKHNYKNRSTASYIASTLTILFFLLTYPTLLVKGYALIGDWLNNNALVFISQKSLINQHIELGISAALFILVAFLYNILVPCFSSKLKKRILMQSPRRTDSIDDRFIVDINSNFSWKIYSLIVNYISCTLLLILVFSYGLVSSEILIFLLRIWLFLPILMLATLPSIIILLILAIVTSDSLRKGINKPSLTTIIFYLIRLIFDLDEFRTKQELSNSEKLRLISSITQISELMRSLYLYNKKTSGYGISKWAVQQMEKSADNFLSLAAWLYFPQYKTWDNLSESLCNYLNIFISGKYHELPRGEAIYHDFPYLIQLKKNGLAKLQSITWLFILVCLPVIFMLIFVVIFKAEISPFIQLLLGLLYVIWIMFTLLSFADNLNSESKGFLIDIIKSLIARK